MQSAPEAALPQPSASNLYPLLPSIERYIDRCATVRRLSTHTVRAYRRDLRDFATLISGSDLDLAASQAAIGAITENSKLAVRTISRKLTSIRGFLRSLDEDLAFAVFKSVRYRPRLPKLLPRSRPKDELELLLNKAGAARTVTTYLVLLVLTSTGLRISETCSLKLGDVDVQTGAIKVFGKGSKERIVMVTNEMALSALRRHYFSRLEAEGLEGPFFRDCRGNILTPTCFRLRLHRLAKSVGLMKRITPHMFRHSAATMLIEAGIDIRIVQRLLGHASIVTTQIYAYVSDNALRQALEKADVIGRLLK